MDASQLRRIEIGEVAEPGIDVLERIANNGLGLPVVTIAPSGYYTVAQLEAAYAELEASSVPLDRKRDGLQAIADQLDKRRKEGRGQVSGKRP